MKSSKRKTYRPAKIRKCNFMDTMFFATEYLRENNKAWSDFNHVSFFHQLIMSNKYDYSDTKLSYVGMLAAIAVHIETDGKTVLAGYIAYNNIKKGVRDVKSLGLDAIMDNPEPMTLRRY